MYLGSGWTYDKQIKYDQENYWCAAKHEGLYLMHRNLPSYEFFFNITRVSLGRVKFQPKII